MLFYPRFNSPCNELDLLTDFRRLRRGRMLLEGFSGVTSVGSERVASIRFRFGGSGVASVA
jgi:hypothetical protein